MDASERRARLSPGRVAAAVASTYRARWRLLLGAALAVYVPLGLIEACDEFLSGPLSELGDDAAVAGLAALIALASVHAAGALLGEVLFAGIVTAIVVASAAGRGPALREVARGLPYGRLIAADVLVAVVVALGILALVVPGLLFLAWFALIAPAIEVEELGVRAAFRRSRELVRGNTLRMLGLLLALLALQGVFEVGVDAALSATLDHGLIATWLASTLANLLIAPLYALAIVVAYFELSGSRR